MWSFKIRWFVFSVVLISISALADTSDLVDELREIPAEAELVTQGRNVPLTEEVQVKLADGLKNVVENL